MFYINSSVESFQRIEIEKESKIDDVNIMKTKNMNYEKNNDKIKDDNKSNEDGDLSVNNISITMSKEIVTIIQHILAK